MNNILHLKYALEVAKTGSISKAAESLFMAQPHLSKAIKELEDSLGITIFIRTTKGVTVTPKGGEFLKYARNIVTQVDEMETFYKSEKSDKHKFDISVPRASYLSFAFINLIQTINHENNTNFNYRETNSVKAIKNVSDSINNLGIIRYQTIYEQYFLNTLIECDLLYKHIWEYENLVLISAENPLANKKRIEYSELSEYTEVVHGDISIPSLPINEARKISQSYEQKQKIAIYERASQMEILSSIPSMYMLVSPIPNKVLKRFNLVLKPCNIPHNSYKDILIYRRGYHLRYEDELFIKKIESTINLIENEKAES